MPGARFRSWLRRYSPGKVKKLDIQELWFEIAPKAVKQLTS